MGISEKCTEHYDPPAVGVRVCTHTREGEGRARWQWPLQAGVGGRAGWPAGARPLSAAAEMFTRRMHLQIPKWLT